MRLRKAKPSAQSHPGRAGAHRGQSPKLQDRELCAVGIRCLQCPPCLGPDRGRRLSGPTDPMWLRETGSPLPRQMLSPCPAAAKPVRLPPLCQLLRLDAHGLGTSCVRLRQSLGALGPLPVHNPSSRGHQNHRALAGPFAQIRGHGGCGWVPARRPQPASGSRGVFSQLILCPPAPPPSQKTWQAGGQG